MPRVLENHIRNSEMSLQGDEFIRIPCLQSEEEKETEEIKVLSSPSVDTTISWKEASQWPDNKIQDTSDEVNCNVDFCIAQLLSILEKKIDILTEIRRKLKLLQADLQKESRHGEVNGERSDLK